MGNLNGDYIIYGGVNVKSSEVAKKSVVADEKGINRYVISFKNGVKASYKKGDGKGSISSCQEKLPDGIYYSNDPQKRSVSTNTNVYDVMGLEIKGTKKLDCINIENSKIINVDVASDGTYDEVQIRNSKGNLDKSVLKNEIGFGEVTADKKDAISIIGSKNITKD